MMAIFDHRHLQRLQMGWTLVEQGWTLSNTSRVTCLGPQGPQKVTPGVPRDPKTAIFCPKCPLLAIGTSNSSKWVGHWLDKVGYYQTHPEGSIWTLKAPKKWHRRPQRRQKWPLPGTFRAILVQKKGHIGSKLGHKRTSRTLNRDLKVTKPGPNDQPECISMASVQFSPHGSYQGPLGPFRSNKGHIGSQLDLKGP